jgi:hypothetical protein
VGTENALAQDEESGRAGGEAGGQGGLGAERSLMPPGNSTPANILNRQVGGIAAHRIEPPYVDVALDPSSQDFGVAVGQNAAR